ncbi:MAG: RdgB/HAM1 family non-canonical purine NTP pyrophosphatase [Ferruginibacter sp.]
MKSIIFATNNQHKVQEIRSVLKNNFGIISLKDAGILIEIPEPHDTLEANAREKSLTISRITGSNCFSEDTGLEVTALKGEPGVKSARYAGENASFEENTDKLLARMQGIETREARFRTVISLILEKKEYQFEGICPGTITTKRMGNACFGYDPVFIPLGATKTFAEMTMNEKNIYSHRRKATDKFIQFLQEQHEQS